MGASVSTTVPSMFSEKHGGMRALKAYREDFHRGIYIRYVLRNYRHVNTLLIYP
jgi:hypothetical protein